MTMLLLCRECVTGSKSGNRGKIQGWHSSLGGKEQWLDENETTEIDRRVWI